jgi:hypothetical protein
VSAQPTQAVSEAFQQNIGGFTPQTRSEVHGFFTGLADMYREGGKSLQMAADRMTTEHIHPSVIEGLRELGGITAALADHGEALAALHHSQHEVWLED